MQTHEGTSGEHDSPLLSIDPVYQIPDCPRAKVVRKHFQILCSSRGHNADIRLSARVFWVLAESWKRIWGRMTRHSEHLGCSSLSFGTSSLSVLGLEDSIRVAGHWLPRTQLVRTGLQAHGCHGQLFMDSKNCTQALKLVWQVSYQLNHHPHPQNYFC